MNFFIKLQFNKNTFPSFTIMTNNNAKTNTRLYLYHLTQTENKRYDTFDSCIVCAYSEIDAKTIDPCGGEFKEGCKSLGWSLTRDGIKCELIGTAAPHMVRDVLLASYNAG